MINPHPLKFPLVAALCVASALPALVRAVDLPPDVTTLAATIPVSGQATLNGSVNARNLNTAVTFEWGPTTNYGFSFSAVPSNVGGNSFTAVSRTFADLNTATTYHYRVKAVSLGGTTYGQDVAFTPLAGAPSATTTAATGVTGSGGTLTGVVNGAGAKTDVTFQFGPTTSYGTTVSGTPTAFTSSTDTPVSFSVSGFAPNTTIHYRVIAKNATSTTNGADVTFTTNPLPPTVQPPGTSGVTSSSATLISSVNTNGGSTVVTFEYGLTDTYGSTATAWESPKASGSGIVHAQVSGLAGGTTYHFRVKATNAGGMATSQDRTFITPPTPEGSATAITQSATLIKSTSATLNGVINNNGNAATTGVDFEYGLTSAYGSGISAQPSIVSGSTDTAVSRSVGGLSANTTYHYRLRAQTGSSFMFGEDRTFTTPATGFPAVSTAPATQVTNTQARLNAFVSSNGGPVITSMAFEYGPDASYGSTLSFGDQLLNSNFVAVSTFLPVSGENVTYHYRVKATNANGTTVGQDVTFTTPDPHDAKLSGLGLSSGSLSPAFNSTTTAYTVAAPYEVTSITLTPTAAQTAAAITVNGITGVSGAPCNPVDLVIGENTITTIVTAPDGLATQTYTVTVTRAAARAGSLDFTFNGSGKVTTLLTSLGGYAYKVVIQPDGKILLAGYVNIADTDDFALVRYLPDGTLDSSFNGTGMVVTAVGPGADYAANLALQSDGKIVVCGRASNGNDDDFALVRYNADGTLDNGFGTNGIATLNFNDGEDNATSVAVLSDGKILVSGSAFTGTKRDFAVARYLANGTLDPDFGTGGKVTTELGFFDNIAAGMTVQPDGRILVVGTIAGSGDSDIAVVRYTADGALDTDFNDLGISVVSISNIGDVGYSLAVQSDGKILVSGAAQNNNWDTALLRLNSDGSQDFDFGGGDGVVVTDLTNGGDWAESIALQPDGRIVVVAETYGPNTMSLMRFMSDGSLDGTFGSSGKVTTSFGDVDEGGFGVALQSDGRIVSVGTSGNYNSYEFAVARYLGDGPAIALKQTAGPNLFDGLSTVDFGSRLAGSDTSISFTVQNPSLVALTGLAASTGGTNAGDFVITANPTASVASLQNTTFTVRFTPSSVGAKTAVLHVASNVTGSNASFDIALTGLGLTHGENWRQEWFGGAANTGEAADDAMPQGDGVTNLMKFATGMNPTQPGVVPITSTKAANTMTFTYTRNKAAVADGVIYTVEWSETLDPLSWNSVGVSDVGVVDQGTIEDVTVSVPAGTNGRRFVRLRVVRP